MKITYELTEREKEFLIALRDKEYPQFAYSGRMSDDKFIREWKEEIDTFKQNKLFENVNNGYDSYWEYRLNEEGMKLIDETVKEETK